MIIYYMSKGEKGALLPLKEALRQLPASSQPFDIEKMKDDLCQIGWWVGAHESGVKYLILNMGMTNLKRGLSNQEDDIGHLQKRW